ncbi:MAG: metallophosphoesterase [Sedimentisphaerales bacterium]|nr:metallophosphoesterase [Sedimentisphaerales bacterium]
MSIGFSRRDMLRLVGVGAASMSLPTGLLGAQKDGRSKQAVVKPLTFFGWSDTHIPVHGDGSKLWPAIDAMNRLPGKAFPKNIGGVVDTPAFVFNCGDITDWPTHQAKKTYEDLITKRLMYPSYEILGNHDEAGAAGVEHPPPIMKEWFKKRYGDLSYTFDQGGIHFVCPFSAYDESLGNPAQDLTAEAMDFIRKNLHRHYSPGLVPAKLVSTPKGTPIVVATHLCFDAMTNRDAFVDALGDANVIMALGGHYHKAKVTHYRGVNFVQLPSVNSEWQEVTVIRITSNRLIAIPYDYAKHKWIDNPGKILDVQISG